jgi:hypothetical protein
VTVEKLLIDWTRATGLMENGMITWTITWTCNL